MQFKERECQCNWFCWIVLRKFPPVSLMLDLTLSISLSVMFSELLD